MDWGIAYLTVCQKSICLVEFEIFPYFDSLSVVTSCQVVKKNSDFRNLIRANESSSVPNLSSFAKVHQTIPVGWLVGGWTG